MVRVRVEATQEEIALNNPSSPENWASLRPNSLHARLRACAATRSYKRPQVVAHLLERRSCHVGNGSLDRYRTVASATIQCRDSRDAFSAHLPQGESFYNPRDKPAQEGK